MKLSLRAAPSLLGIAATVACVQIDTERTVTTHPVANEPARVIGSVSTQIVARGTEVEWTQAHNVLRVTVVETPQCKTVEHHPVEHVTEIDRTVRHGGLYWEYGASAAALGLGLAALIRPQAFSPQGVNAQGEVGTDNATGYRIGGIFTALGAAGLGVAIYDTKRSRDTTTTTRAYAVKLGASVDCAQAKTPAAGAELELALGTWSTQGRADSDGAVTFALPPEELLQLPTPPANDDDATSEPSPSSAVGQDPDPASSVDPAASSTEAKPDAEPPTASESGIAAEPDASGSPAASAVAGSAAAPVEREATLRLPSGRSVPLVFIAPYQTEAAAEHRGHASLPASSTVVPAAATPPPKP